MTNTNEIRVATESWVNSSIKKEFDPIDINDVYAAFEAGANWQSQQAQGEPGLAATCPECHGLGWDMDCQDELRPSACPDCAGSGKAERSITVQESDSAVPDVSAHNVRLISQSMAFLASAIKSGEEWSEQCQHIYDRAQDTLTKLNAPPAPAAVPEGHKDASGLVQVLESIVEYYPHPDIDHERFRVLACRFAEQALSEYRALSEYPTRDVCTNCETALPEGCGGIFAHDGTACRYVENQQEEAER